MKEMREDCNLTKTDSLISIANIIQGLQDRLPYKVKHRISVLRNEMMNVKVRYTQ